MAEFTDTIGVVRVAGRVRIDPAPALTMPVTRPLRSTIHFAGGSPQALTGSALVRGARRIAGTGAVLDNTCKVPFPDAVKRYSSHMVYAPLLTTVNPVGRFAGTVKSDDGTPLHLCSIRAIDVETGVEASRAGIDEATGEYAIEGLLVGRQYTLQVVNLIYSPTVFAAFGPITAT